MKIKFRNPFKKHRTSYKNNIPNMSMYHKDKPIYVETYDVAQQSDEFRKDYRKVVMCIQSSKNLYQVKTSRRMYNNFIIKHKVNIFNLDIDSKTYFTERQFIENVSGYLETLIQQRETIYAIV